MIGEAFRAAIHICERLGENVSRHRKVLRNYQTESCLTDWGAIVKMTDARPLRPPRFEMTHE